MCYSGRRKDEIDGETAQLPGSDIVHKRIEVQAHNGGREGVGEYRPHSPMIATLEPIYL